MKQISPLCWVFTLSEITLHRNIFLHTLSCCNFTFWFPVNLRMFIFRRHAFYSTWQIFSLFPQVLLTELCPNINLLICCHNRLFYLFFLPSAWPGSIGYSRMVLWQARAQQYEIPRFTLFSCFFERHPWLEMSDPVKWSIFFFFFSTSLSSS